jgi:penicillin-binding protein 1A
MKQVGPSQFANFLERINIPTHVEPYPSIALGSCDLSLYEMMWGYSMFPGHGFSTKPVFISRIEDRNGNVIKRLDFGVGRKEVVSEATAYQMCQMMEGPVTKGTAAGLMQRLGAKEMGGKTGTTNDNADAWFMGYTPQLLAGVWIGSDDRFIHIESAQGYGGTAARPIWEAFFKKVYADRSLGVDKDAEFIKPADMQNQINSADILNSITPDSGAQGDNQNVNADDYGLDSSHTFMRPESQKPVDDNDGQTTLPAKSNKKDSSAKKPQAATKPDEQKDKKKKNFFQRIFGNKDDKEKQSGNDY